MSTNSMHHRLMVLCITFVDYGLGSVCPEKCESKSKSIMDLSNHENESICASTVCISSMIIHPLT